MGDPERGGVNPTSKSWKRTIYLITDGKHRMNKESTDAIADRIIEDNVSLRVIGIDFDDEEFGFQEENKDSIKAENEEWWHNWLQQLPDSRIATAACAMEQASLPHVSLQSSAAFSTALTFGNPEAQYTTGDAMSIPVKMLNLTTRVLPMSRKTMSKLAEQTESAKREKQATQQALSQFLSQDGLPMPTPTPKLPELDSSEGLANTYMVDQRRLFFFADEAKEIGTENAKPLEEGAEENFRHAYKLGASLIPITPDLDMEWQSDAGLFIIEWHKQESFKRHYLLGNIWNIFADSNNLEAQLQMSSLVKAMKAQGKIAIVRFVRRQNSEPKLGVLYPVTRIPGETEADYFHFAEVPFAEDLKRYPFPSLERVITADGKELKEHRSLPSNRMVSTMESLVDSMDLSQAYTDENGENLSWFSTEDSFNPAVHRMKDAVAWRVMHPESKELPRPHWEVDKFLDRPPEIQTASHPWVEECKSLFNIRYYPEKGIIKAKEKRERELQQKAAQALSRLELDLGGDTAEDGAAIPEANSDKAPAAPESSPSHKKLKDATGQSQSVQGKLIAEDSDTDDDEEDMLAPASSSHQRRETKQEVPSQTMPPPQVNQSQTQTQTQTRKATSGQVPSASDANDEDDGDSSPAPPPINLLSSDPVGSFHFYLEDARMDQGEVLRALERLIVQLIKAGKEESSRLARDALCAGKTAASEYDEAREWNAFIREFKSCLTGSTTSSGLENYVDPLRIDIATHLNTSHKSFWIKYCSGNRQLGLVTQDEDEGKRSRVSAREASEVRAYPRGPHGQHKCHACLLI